MTRYRERIYEHYISARNEEDIPHTKNALESRGPTMRYTIRKFFPKDKDSKILELGCGHGALLYFAQSEGYKNSMGVDISEQQVALSKKLGISNVKKGDIKSELKNTPPGSLDAVVAFDVIEHFTKEELVELVDAVHLVLKPEGCWIIHVPNGGSPFVGTVLYGDYTHEQAFTPATIKQLMRASGFKKFEFSESAPQIHGIKSFIRVVLWKLIRNIFNVANAAETGVAGNSEILWTRNFFAVAYK